MPDVDGITFESHQGQCLLFHVETFSEALKEVIRNYLVEICHGQYRATREKKTYTYKLTIGQLNARLATKTPEQKKGMIGEVLCHVLLNQFVPSLNRVSLFFNLEEGQVKKGFDIVLSDTSAKEIWITEVKAGEKNEQQTVDQKTIALITDGKNDLRGRLNGGNQNLWQNALNHLEISRPQVDQMEWVKEILTENLNPNEGGASTSSDFNVILTGALFNPLTNKVQLTTLTNHLTNIENENCFKKVILLSIQKNTFNRVIEFFNEEANRDQ